jgi:phosphoglycolate phosphatase
MRADEGSASLPPWAPRALVFDLDGTLVDSRHAVVEAVAAGIEDVLHRHGLGDAPPSSAAVAAAMGLAAEEYYRTILPAGLQHLAAEVQAACTRHEVAALAAGRGCLYPGVLFTLTALREAGVRLAAISNAQSLYFHAALMHLQLRPLLQHAECHGDLPADGPRGKHTLLVRALDALRASPGESCMVGDRREDLEAGRQAGCRTIGVRFGFGAPHELAIADAVVDRFAAILELLGVARPESDERGAIGPPSAERSGTGLPPAGSAPAL